MRAERQHSHSCEAMKINIALSILFLTSVGFAQRHVDLIPLQLQFRYEETANQAKETVQYQTLGFAIQIEKYRLGFESSQNEERTGNASFSVENDRREDLLFGGASIFRMATEDQQRSVDLMVNGLMGSTQSKVTTQLLGTPSTATSDKAMVYGVSLSLIGRLKYLMVESEFRILNSKNFNPQTVPAIHFKLGAGIPF